MCELKQLRLYKAIKMGSAGVIQLWDRESFCWRDKGGTIGTKEREVSSINNLLENGSLKCEVNIDWMSRKSIVRSRPVCDCKVIKSMSGSCHLFICNQFFSGELL